MKFEGIDVIQANPTHPESSTVWMSPGWIDLQVNGFAGHDFNSSAPEPATVGHVAETILKEGVTCFFPTVITQSEAHMTRCLQAIAAGCAENPLARDMVGGIHLEGPWLSPEEGARGAHSLEQLRLPDEEEFLRLQQAAGGRIKLVTLAPELPGAVPFIEKLVQQGIVVSLGHTMATQQEIEAAVDAGATLSTHLGNGAPSIMPRHPNMIWSQLAEDRLFASVILDGHHLPACVMKSIFRAKGVERLILVSDAAAPARCAPGIYDASIGGQVELSASGRLSLLGTPYLAGAALGMKEGIANAITHAGATLAEACRMASVNPARLMGLSLENLGQTYFTWNSASQQLVVIGAELST